MILRRIFVIAFALFTVTLNTACPHDIAAQVAEESTLRKEYDDKTEERRVVDLDLWSNHKIYIGTGTSSIADTFTTISWAATSQFERDQDRSLLMKYLTLTGRLIELADHKAVKDQVTDYTRMTLRNEQRSAKSYLDSLNTFERK